MKNISKALAMAVMMSVLAGGSAYATAYNAGGGTASGVDSIAIGSAYAGNKYSIAIGYNSSAESDYSSAIGYNAGVTGKQSVALGADSKATEDNTISVGSSTNQRRIVNVAVGTKATDAVNLGQMEAAIAAIGTGSYDDTSIKADIAKKANQTDVEKNAADIADHETRITKLEEAGGGASSEALEKLDSKINQTNDRVDRVGATAAALAGIHYQPMAKGQSQVAVGMGGYKGKKATALGLAYQISDRVSGSVAGAANGSERMFNVGFNYLFGQHSDKDIAQCAAVPGSVSLKEAEMQATIDSQNAKINGMEARIAQLEAMVKALAAK